MIPYKVDAANGGVGFDGLGEIPIRIVWAIASELADLQMEPSLFGDVWWWCSLLVFGAGVWLTPGHPLKDDGGKFWVCYVLLIKDFDPSSFVG